jgi:hypothetical protein
MILQEPSAGSTEIGVYESSSAAEKAQVRAAVTAKGITGGREEGRVTNTFVVHSELLARLP